MITIDQARTLSGQTLHGSDGEKIGKIDTLYADRDGGEPTFATVHTGMFGSKTSFVPLADASMTDGGVMVPYGKDLISSAPQVDPDAELEPAEEDRLYAHYGVGGAGYDSGYTGTTTGTTATMDTTRTTADTGYADVDTSRATGAVGRDTSGPETDDAMTRSEERLQVGTQKTEAGRARLRKYIVTETETVTVPVSHEEVRIEREPITEANRGAALSGKDLSEEEHEVVLHAETPLVAKETVPVERVRLETETVTGQETVSEDVRKEVIETDGVTIDVDAGREQDIRR